MKDDEKHFKTLTIKKDSKNDYLVLDNSSFWDIKFDYLYGENIQLIHNNAFGKASETIKKINISNGYVNHKPPKYDVWKVLSGLVNVEEIHVQLDITEIPTQAFIPLNGMQINLKKISIRTNNRVKVKEMAFHNLYNLNEIFIYSKIMYEYEELFEFRKNLTAMIIYCKINENEACINREKSFNNISYTFSYGNGGNWGSFTSSFSYYKVNYDSLTYNKLSSCKINDTLALDRFENVTCHNSNSNHNCSYASFVFLIIFLIIVPLCKNF